MINRLIDEIGITINNGLYLSALTAALTLPDVCGKAQYPEKRTKDRYISWLSEHVKDSNLSFEDIYALRCSLLHEGNANPEGKINRKFRLMVNWLTDRWGIDFCFNASITHADGSTERDTTVYVGYLCTVICNAAKTYFQANKGKFNFLNYEIVDVASMFRI